MREYSKFKKSISNTLCLPFLPVPHLIITYISPKVKHKYLLKMHFQKQAKKMHFFSKTP